MLITSEHLEGACQDQIDLFNKTFPVGAEFNKTNWVLALSVGLKILWMEKFLDESNRTIYYKATAPAQKIYAEATTPAQKIYAEAATAAARKIYNDAIESDRKIYDEAITSALKIYEKNKEVVCKIYEETKATALFNVLEKQFNGVK